MEENKKEEQLTITEEQLTIIENKGKEKKRTRSKNSHLKCQKCGNKYKRELMSPINKKFYCPTCFNIVLRENEEKERLKEENKKLKEEKDKEEAKKTKGNKRLNDLLYEIVNGDKQGMAFLTAGIYKAIERKEFTAMGAVLTLNYIKELGRWEEVTQNNVYFMILKYYNLAREEWLVCKRNYSIFSDDYVQTVLQRPATEIIVNRSDINKDDKKFIEAQRTLLYGPEINLDDIEDNN